MHIPFFQGAASDRENHLADTESNLSRWKLAIGVCCLATLTVVVVMSIWGVRHDLNLVRETLVASEMQRLRSLGHRTIVRLQDRWRQAKRELDLESMRDDPTLRRIWEVGSLAVDDHLYSAITDPSGTVIAHCFPKHEGMELGSAWYDRVIPEAGDDVVLTRSPALTGGVGCLDVRLPIYWNDKIIGYYHNGLDLEWFEGKYVEKSSRTLGFWTWNLTFIVAAIALAGVALLTMGRRASILHELVKVNRARRLAELGQLMTGIVHEIRNPLNAMRLNLHVLRRSLDGHAHPPATEPAAADFEPERLIADMNQEIERVEGLMRLLLGYARPAPLHPELVDLRTELESTLNFLRPILERTEIGVRARFADASLIAMIDRQRLRQVLINLIQNAREAVEPGGMIQIELAQRDQHIEIEVKDDGPGVPPGDRERVFEPFYSTKEAGTGLGLPLVRRYLDEAGGTITCGANEPRGARFVVRIPITAKDTRQPAAAAHKEA